VKVLLANPGFVEIMSSYDDEDEYEEEMDGTLVKDDGKFPLPPVDLDEDTFGMSVCSLTRDSYFISFEGLTLSRIVRLVTSLFLVLLTVMIQVWLLMKVKEFVCARAVHDIRNSYDKYQLHMYKNTTLTANGKHRGIPGTFPNLTQALLLLDTMSEDDQDNICRIPLSQPYFFGLVLIIWTLTCFAELRKAYTLQSTLMMLPTVDSMSESVGAGDDDSSDLDAVIKGMTVLMKIGLTLLTFVPRVSVTLYLLWVGCRWLLATNNFGDLILNAVALEFILLIKEGLYVALMPTRSHLDLTVTKIMPYPDHMTSSWWNFVNTVFLLLIAFLWVFLYMRYWQQVLPQYNWDVHEVCESYIKTRYAV
jgi:hypothetical protein